MFVHLFYRECPEECVEAIASLMFAAARFSDLPELRDLRQIFQERFGTSLEHLENRKVTPSQESTDYRFPESFLMERLITNSVYVVC